MVILCPQPAEVLYGDDYLNYLKDHGWEKDHARTKFHNMLPQRKARGNAWTHTDLEGGKNDSAIRQ